MRRAHGAGQRHQPPFAPSAPPYARRTLLGASTFKYNRSRDLPRKARPRRPPDERSDRRLRRSHARPKPGERRLQILQTLASDAAGAQGDRVTTAALAGRLQVSEAALYRHFASKAQMFEGLIEFIESTCSA